MLAINTVDIKIRQATIEDEAQISALFERVYKRPISSEIVKWWQSTHHLALQLLAAHQSNHQKQVPTIPYDIPPFGLLACVDGKAVGYLGIQLRACLVEGQTALAGELVNAMVDESCRGRGISTQLCEYLIAHLNTWSLAIIYGLPNQMNKGALLKAGMKILGTYGRWVYVKSTWQLRLLKVRNGIKRVFGLSNTTNLNTNIVIQCVADNATDLMPSWALDNDFVIVRTIDYWRIRYDTSAKTYTASRTDEGAFVLKLDANASWLCATLVDLLPVETTKIEHLIKSAMEHAWVLGAQTFEARAIEGSDNARAIQSLGFSRYIGDFPMAFATSEQSTFEAITKAISNGELWMTTGDFDIG